MTLVANGKSRQGGRTVRRQRTASSLHRLRQPVAANIPVVKEVRENDRE